jgi:hypothetical protein
MKQLAMEKRKILRFLAEWEEEVNANGNRPLWERNIYPRSKKRVHELLQYQESEWIELFDNHLDLMLQRYSVISESRLMTVKACLTLDLPPKVKPFRLPFQKDIQKAFLKRCPICHPDTGGDGKLFTLLQERRTLLRDRIRE